MNLLEIITQVRSFLEQNGRVSYRMLRRQFELDDDALDEMGTTELAGRVAKGLPG